MVAAYAIGFPVSQQWMDAHPHLMFAAGALVINPLNWKRDDTPASVKENRGKLVQNHTLHSWKIVPATTGAVLNLGRGTVIAENNTDYDTDKLAGFGDKTLHTYDYGELYMNLRENTERM